MRIKGLLILIVILLTIFTIACKTPKNITYFENIPRDTIITGSNTAPEYIIHSNDLLYISLTALDENMVRLLNAPNTAGTLSSYGISGLNSLSLPNGGFLVDKDGFIHYPFLGKVRASGLSKNDLGDTLQNALLRRKLVIDPVIDIRIQNFRITVLGEVAKPSVIVVPNEKISLPEALGIAGDLTIYGKRENVLIVREENNSKIYHRVNLNGDSIFNSPYYYLHANDLVYVEPGRIKKHSATWASIYLPVVISGFLTVVYVILSKL